MDRRFDAVIIGGGAAGYTAGLYCAQAGFAAAVVERTGPGGQIATAGQVDNYPGFPEGVDGFELGQRMQSGAERAGVESIFAQVTAVSLVGEVKRVDTTAGTLRAPCVVLATGAGPRELGLAGEREMRGRGVSYCATCDAMFYRGKTVAVVGGGNTAVQEALHLARVCGKVYLVHRRDALAASGAYVGVLKEAGVELLWNRRVTALEADGPVLGGVELTDTLTGEKAPLPCQGLFVAIGRAPDTALFRGQVDMDEAGYILAGEDTKTNLPGVFAAGDLRVKPLRQLVTAAADGAVAAKGVGEYLSKRAQA